MLSKIIIFSTRTGHIFDCSSLGRRPMATLRTVQRALGLPIFHKIGLCPGLFVQKSCELSTATKINRSKSLETWMHSVTGRNVVSYLLAAVAVTAFSACILPHSYCMDWLKRVLQAYKDGVPETLNPVVQIRAEQVLRECNILEREKRLISFFPVCGFNITHCGSASLIYGALVGIPINFKYQKIEEIERPSIRVHNNSEVSWSSIAGQSLQESLILSEDAQKFAIAREVHASCNYYTFYNAGILSMCILLASTFPRHVNDRMNLFQRPRTLRLMLYTLSSAIGAAFYVTIKDMINVYFDKHTDDMAAKMGPSYLKGGIEFYEKQLQMNRALRTLMGDFGEKSFTIHGNDKTWFRTPHLTPVARLDFLKEYLRQEASVEDMDE